MSVTTFRQLVPLYLSNRAAKQSAETLEGRQRIFDAFAAEFGDVPLANLTPADLVFWLDRHPEWKSEWTRKRTVSSIQCVLNWGRRLRLCINPFEGVSNPEGDRGRPITSDELRKLLRVSSALFRRAVLFMHLTGARPHEMSTIEWSFIDCDRGCIVLDKHKTRNSRKDKAPRTIILSPVCVKLLTWILSRQKRGERFVFLNARGRPWNANSLGLRMLRIRIKSGIPPQAKLYGLRHLFGTTCILRGVDLKTLAELMGHTTTKMTEHYVHIAGNVSHLHGALEKVWGTSK